MARRRVFVSFDYDNDKRYKFLLEAWDANPEFEFTFTDLTPEEIDSDDVGRIKGVLTRNINSATHTLVIVGAYANALHRLHREIGFRNWINFEVHQSKENGNRLAAIKLQGDYALPEELAALRQRIEDVLYGKPGARVTVESGFSEENVLRALRQS